jgi:uncharacterized membrane protein YgcG
MLRTLLFLFVFSFSALIASSQTIILKGKLTDKDDKSPIVGATIRLVVQKDTTQSRMVITTKTGNFAFNDLAANAYTIYISYSGYEKIQQKINIQASNNVPLPFAITKVSTDLIGVTVIAKTPPVRQKVDTTEFSASQFKVNPDATAEDLIKKLPGIVIDKAGNVTTMGDQVKKVTVDGRDFFGDDATAALRNLPADIIDKIQVFDKLSDQAAFTGFDDGNSTKAINIVTKSGMRNGQFGRMFVGYGTDGRYNGGGNISFFKKDRRISLVGLFNNINQQNFSSEDLLGVTSSSGGSGRGGSNRGGGGGGNRGGGSFGGGGNNFLVGQTNGISATNSFGINYSDIWGKKLTVSGSYFFNNSNTNNDQSSNTQYVNQNKFYNETDLSSSKNYNHRVNLRMEYKIDEKNSIIFTPTLSYQKNSSLSSVNGLNFVSASDSLSKANSTTNASTSGYNSNNNLLFRHAFAKKGRTISLNLSAGYNHKSGDTYLNSLNQYYDSTGTLVTTTTSTDQLKQQLVDGSTYTASLAYTEPIGKKGQLQINYSPSVSKNKSDQESFNYDNTSAKYSLFDTAFSNKFNSTTSSESAGISYRLGDRDNMFAVGLNYKYLQLSSDQIFPQTVSVYKSFNNLLPNLMWRKKLSAKSTLNIMYRASTTTPSISQLQNVIDNSNPLLVTSGNPDLKQQVSNTLSTRYTFTNTQKGNSFFANLFLQQADNYVATASYIAAADSVLTNGDTLHKGSQLTKPVNLNGYLSLRTFLTYAIPLKFIKSNLNINGGVTYSKLPGLNNNLSGISNSYTYNTGVGITSNISQYVDFNISYNASFTNTKNTLDPTQNTNYTMQSAEVALNLLDKKGWFIQNDVTATSYSGLGAGYNQTYILWNASTGKKFLKNQAGELKLSVFDLLKQNQSITRTVDLTSIEDVHNQVLQQYFMLTFTYKLKNFGVAKASTNTNRNFGGNRPGNGFPPGF